MKKIIIAAMLLPNIASAEEIVIACKRLPIPAKKVIVFKTQKIEDQQAVALQDTFRTVSAINFSQTGGFGTPSSVRIRGAEGDKTLFIIDGQKIQDPSLPSGGFDFGQTLIGDVSRIEIIKGIGSSLYGSDAIGGVINVFTQKPENPNTLRFSLEGGSESTKSIKALYGNEIGKFSYALYGTHFETGGISQFANNLGGQESDGFKQDLAGVKGWFSLSENSEIFAKSEYSKSKLDFDGYPAPHYNFSDTAEYGETTNQTNFVKYESEISDKIIHSISWSQYQSKRQNFNPSQSPSINFDSVGKLQSLDYLASIELMAGFSILGGASIEKGQYSIAYPAPWDPNPAKLTAKAETKSVFIEGEYSPSSDFVAKLGARNDKHNQFGSEVSWHSNLSWRAPLGIDVFGAFGEGFKAPSLYQLYSDYGNLDLVAETASGFEFGIAKNLSPFNFSINYFNRKSKNQIDFFSCFGSSHPKCATRPYGFYDNIAKTKTNGIEYDLSINYSDFDIQFGGAIINARNNDVASFDFGNQLARQAKNTGFIDIKYHIDSEFSVFINGQFVGKRRENIYSEFNLASYNIWSVGFSKALTENYQIFGRIENLFDTKYETVKNYGSYGKGFKFGLRIKYN